MGVIVNLLGASTCCDVTGGDDARDSAVGIHAVLAAVPDRHHLRRIQTQQT